MSEARNEENKQLFALIMSNCDLTGDFFPLQRAYSLVRSWSHDI